MKVVVTGGHAALRRGVAALLAEQRHDVSVLDGPETPGGADLGSDESVAALARLLTEDAVMVHLVPIEPLPHGHGDAEARRRWLFERTVLGTLRVLDAARQRRARQVVLVSSPDDAAAGRPAPTPAGAAPLDDRAAALLAAEDHARAFAEEEHIPVALLRLEHGAHDETALAIARALAAP